MSLSFAVGGEMGVSYNDIRDLWTVYFQKTGDKPAHILIRARPIDIIPIVRHLRKLADTYSPLDIDIPLADEGYVSHGRAWQSPIYTCSALKPLKTTFGYSPDHLTELLGFLPGKAGRSIQRDIWRARLDPKRTRLCSRVKGALKNDHPAYIYVLTAPLVHLPMMMGDPLFGDVGVTWMGQRLLNIYKWRLSHGI